MLGFCRDASLRCVSRVLLSNDRRCALGIEYRPTIGFCCSDADVESNGHLYLACVRAYRYSLKLPNATDCKMSLMGKVENENEISFGRKG
jgi:hypothetical protein